MKPGEKLGPYEITAFIGAGGMGEVYRALDPRLGREVAIKVSAERFSERFEREARAVAALNHPNICTLFDVGPNYLVMEFVEGAPPKGPMPVDEALRISRQIADALEAAHDKGIVHRDLKPGNILIRADGTVKVLDFGLAKMGGTATAASENSPTISMAATQAGVILGTAAYMAPEQARGKPVDKRADIWAFGAVLYEMVTGRQLFAGEDLSHTLASVIMKEPDLEAAPPKLRRVLKRCLEKDPKKRLRDITGVELLLEEGAAPATTAPSRSRLSMVFATVAAAMTVAAMTLAFVHFREKAPEAPALRTTLLPPFDTTLDFTNGLGLPALSPDGRRIVFGARTKDGKNPLWIRPLDGLTAQPLSGTDGATFPFWSPDSRFIAFFADGKLKKIDAAGGPVLTLADAAVGRGGSWGPDGTIIFTPIGTGSPLLRVSSAGGATSPVTSEEARLPWFLPDGRHFLFDDQRTSGERKIRVGSLDGSPSKSVGSGTSRALYSQGHLLYLRDSTLMAQPFDAQRLVTTGEAVPVAEQIQSVLASGAAGVFSVSETGLLSYRGGVGGGSQVLTWFDRAGKPGASVGEAAAIFQIAFSPDRKSVAATVGERGNIDIWIYDVARGLRTRLTFDPVVDQNPVWSPDGRSVAFSSNRRGHIDLYRKAADGAGADEVLYADDLDKIPTSWSADGKFLLYHGVGSNSKTGQDLWALPLTPEKPGSALKPFVVLQTQFNELNAQFSPDGRWIAYESAESQRNEIYVTAFPPPASGQGGKRQISTAGGRFPRWRQDGKEIFYRTQDRMMAAEVVVNSSSVEVGAVHELFSSVSTAGLQYDVAADGQRFLLAEAPDQKAGEPLTLILNWAAGLRK